MTFNNATYTGWVNKNRTFLRYHIFAAIADTIMRFLLKCYSIKQATIFLNES